MIITALRGKGMLGLAAYDSYVNGRTEDSRVSDEEFAAALATVPAPRRT